MRFMQAIFSTTRI